MNTQQLFDLYKDNAAFLNPVLVLGGCRALAEVCFIISGKMRTRDSECAKRVGKLAWNMGRLFQALGYAMSKKYLERKFRKREYQK